MTRRPLAAALLALVLVAGCTSEPPVTRSSVAPTATAPDTTVPETAGPAPDSSGLAAEKAAAGIADCPASDPAVAAVPDGLPDAVLPCLGGGREVRLAGLRGRPMIVNVWAQWCGPCRDEAPFLAEVAADPGSDVLVLGIDHADPEPARALEFARVAGWRYPQVQDRDLVLRRDLQVVALPQTFFVRADGTIAHRNLRPFTSADQIRSLAREHLGVTP
ncbi:TlpA family protein disulfide reductase [Microlunatus capsulatus]|uniref:Thiol-disulfide isomerase/thioredoxin n=1 Tax=Microlunatus capsulatus TaxID=99117 RepID=A0ABS4Z950_9ACTN|nr:TlpA disulfide reductase family protein [Microlunatus capsulatus]MBP2417581.1 thiol-disulfide isomerase/thioredoxin [Microlunatus capsulatus]